MRHSLSDLSPGQTWLLILLVITALLAGLGLREPMPADEPRFVLAAKTMVETGQWLFPYRGIELYAEKPPTFMWLQAASYVLVRSWDVAFLLPSLLAALLTMLNSCSPGVAVVNIDNGYGAGHLAAQIAAPR